MKPRSAKNKGKRLQNWVRDLLVQLSPELKEGDIKSTTMGETGEDVQLSPAAREVWPIQIECKNKEKIAVYQWYEQARQHGKFEPILVIKQNESKPLVVLDAEIFFESFKCRNDEA